MLVQIQPPVLIAALVNRFKTPPFHGGMTSSILVRGTMGLALVLTVIEVKKDAGRIRWKSLNTYQTINAVELSTMTFEDVMSFVGADYAVAA